MLHCDKSPDKLPQRPLRRRSLSPDRHGSDLASLAVVALVGMGAGFSAYPIRASLLKRNRRPGLAIIITLEAAQLELQKIESMTTSIPLERDRDLKRRWYRLLQRAVPSGVPAGDRPIAVRYSGYPVVTLRPIEGLEFVKETFAGSSPPTRKIDGLVAVKVETTRARLWSWFAAPMSPCITLPSCVGGCPSRASS
jgi:hypothetical protein